MSNEFTQTDRQTDTWTHKLERMSARAHKRIFPYSISYCFQGWGCLMARGQQVFQRARRKIEDVQQIARKSS